MQKINSLRGLTKSIMEASSLMMDHRVHVRELLITRYLIYVSLCNGNMYNLTRYLFPARHQTPF
jgi:hypothetical protein